MSDSVVAVPAQRATAARWLVPCVLLSLILVLAAFFRFTGLDWGLRHVPDWDEQVFVESARQMLVAGDLDHRFYEYPGLFPYLVSPVIACAEDGERTSHPARPEIAGASTYLAARGLVACFAVASVALVFLLGVRLMGVAAGLSAALLLAVSPFEVATAHSVRPDVVLEAFVLLALLAFLRVGERLRHDAFAGVAVGMAAGVKFTGGLLVIAYLTYRVLTPGPRLRGTIVAGTAAILTWLLLTPYAVLKPAAFFAGVASQWSYHYRSGEFAPQFLPVLSYYLKAHGQGLGPLGGAIALAGVGLTLARPERRVWLPMIAWAATLLAVLSTADVRYGRLALSASFVGALLVAHVIQSASGGRPAAAALLAIGIALVPLRVSVGYVQDLAQPLASDHAVDWIDANVPERSRILGRLGWLGIDRTRYEVVSALGHAEWDRRLASQFDFVIDRGGDPTFTSLRAAFVSQRPSPINGDHIVVRSVPATDKEVYAPVSLAGARFSASSNGEAASAVADGRPEVQWCTPGSRRAGDWVQVELAKPALLGRVELMIGGRPRRASRSLRLSVRDAFGHWRPIDFVHARAPVEEQATPGRSLVLVLEPTPASAVRIEQTGRGSTRWCIGELQPGSLRVEQVAVERSGQRRAQGRNASPRNPGGRDPRRSRATF